MYITNQSFDSLIPTIKFNRYDAAISAMDITAERSKQVILVIPITTMQQNSINQKINL